MLAVASIAHRSYDAITLSGDDPMAKHANLPRSIG